MSVIIINCVTLGSYEPCLDEAECDNKCQILKAIDDVIFAYFAAEMIIKMVENDFQDEVNFPFALDCIGGLWTRLLPCRELE